MLFLDWLYFEKGYTEKTSKDIQSRIKRVLSITGEERVSANTLKKLEESKVFNTISYSIRSQLRKAIKLNIEYDLSVSADPNNGDISIEKQGDQLNGQSLFLISEKNCCLFGHELESAQIEVPVMNRHQLVFSRNVKVKYCDTCKRYYMSRKVADELLSYGKPMCRLVIEEEYK